MRSKSCFLFQKNCGRPEQWNYLKPTARVYEKRKGFPVIKKANEKISSKKTNRPPKEHKTDLEFHYNNNPETLKTFEKDIRKQLADNFTFQLNYCRQNAVTIYLILQEFLVRGGVDLEHWLEQPLGQLFPFSRRTARELYEPWKT